MTAPLDGLVVADPVRYAEATTVPATRPPRLGEHTDMIRTWLEEN